MVLRINLPYLFNDYKVFYGNIVELRALEFVMILFSAIFALNIFVDILLFHMFIENTSIKIIIQIVFLENLYEFLTRNYHSKGIFFSYNIIIDGRIVREYVGGYEKPFR